jgi:hypothetical protein
MKNKIPLTSVFVLVSAHLQAQLSVSVNGYQTQAERTVNGNVNSGLSPDMKRTAIDNIEGISDEQKTQWKSELQ